MKNSTEVIRKKVQEVSHLDNVVHRENRKGISNWRETSRKYLSPEGYESPDWQGSQNKGWEKNACYDT